LAQGFIGCFALGLVPANFDGAFEQLLIKVQIGRHAHTLAHTYYLVND
jgi:hypothetical protein